MVLFLKFSNSSFFLGVPSPRVATRTRTGALVPKSYSDSPAGNKPAVVSPQTSSASGEAPITFDLSKIAGPLFKLGTEGTFRHYRNAYLESPFAQNKLQKQEERDRKRHLAGKFCLKNDSGTTTGMDFRWLGLTMGMQRTMLSTLRLTMIDVEKTIHPSFFHPHWAQCRQGWIKLVQDAEKPEELAIALTRLESSCKPVIFVPAWHESLGEFLFSFIRCMLKRKSLLILGCSRWGKFTAVDRDEARSRRKDEEELTTRSAKKAYVNFVLGVQHQVRIQRECFSSNSA